MHVPLTISVKHRCFAYCVGTKQTKLHPKVYYANITTVFATSYPQTATLAAEWCCCERPYG